MPTTPHVPHPAQRVSQMIISLWVPQALHAAAELGIADALAEKPLSAHALADRLGTHPEATGRLLDALVVLGLLTRTGEGLATTELGRCLETDSPTSRRAWSRLMGGASVWQSWSRLTECVRTGQKASSLDAAEGTADSSGSEHFDSMDQDPEAAAVFHQAMADLTRGAAPAIVAAASFRGVRRVVDLGGGYGALLCELLATHPDMEGVVFDLAHAREGAHSLFRARGVLDRASYVTGSFFAEAPPPADVYLLKSVIHDWDDERSRRVLGRCREAMTDGARLLLIEVAAAREPRNPALDWIIAFSDLNMLVNTGGRERTVEDYRRLVEGSGLRITSVADAGFYQVFEARRPSDDSPAF
jgi:hypothetical protein